MSDENKGRHRTSIELRRVEVPQSELEELREQSCELEQLRRATAYRVRKAGVDAGVDLTSFVERLLEIVDNFERALSAAQAGSGYDAIVDGLEMVSDQVLDALRSIGVERFTTEGEPYDAARHEIAETVDRTAGEACVIRELRPGYIMGGTILRRAFVVVGGRPGPSRVPQEPGDDGPSADDGGNSDRTFSVQKDQV